MLTSLLPPLFDFLPPHLHAFTSKKKGKLPPPPYPPQPLLCSLWVVLSLCVVFVCVSIHAHPRHSFFYRITALTVDVTSLYWIMYTNAKNVLSGDDSVIITSPIPIHYHPPLPLSLSLLFLPLPLHSLHPPCLSALPFLPSSLNAEGKTQMKKRRKIITLIESASITHSPMTIVLMWFVSAIKGHHGQCWVRLKQFQSAQLVV